MSDFCVTEAMIRHIAIHAMGLVEADERDHLHEVKELDEWHIAPDATLTFGVDEDYEVETLAFRTSPDASAWSLLGWLVRDRGWRVARALRTDGFARASVCAVWHEGPFRGEGDTLCEAIIRAILAASGWVEPFEKIEELEGEA